jgi:hypothetical protein
LLERLSDKIIQRVRTNTRLFELWKVLEQAPFDVCHQPADEKPPVSVVPEAASLAGQKTWNMRFKADWRHYFVMQEQDIFSDTEWANVYIKIGVFAREVRVKTFIPPSAIADGFRNGSNHDAWDAFCEWQTGDPGSLDPYLPDHDYDDSGYGSTREVYTSLRFVHFVLRKSKSGQPEVYVFADNYYDDYYACPPLMTGVKLRDAITQIHPADLEMAFEPAGATLMAHVLPEAIEPLVSERYRAGGPVRIMHTGNSFQDEFHYDVFDERLDGSSISLTEDDERSRTLIYGSHDIEFVPFIETSEDPVTPARKGSLADALLRNASMPTEDQLISLVEHEAKRIAEAGLVYHESLVQHYREIIEKMTAVKKLKQLLTILRRRVAVGRVFTPSMAKHPMKRSENGYKLTKSVSH